jgi:uncharacterized protein (TIGR02996 family)
MADHAAFLRAICDEPDEDAHRLVYADWLDEQGDAARADFIRIQCAQARLARFCQPDWKPRVEPLPADELLPEFRKAFLAPLLDLGLPECISRYHYGEDSGFAFAFRRGLVEDLEVFGSHAAAVFVERADQIFALTPLRYLRFIPERSFEGDPNTWDPLPSDTVEAIARLPQLTRLLTLDLRGHSFTDDPIRVLVSSLRLGPASSLLLGDLYVAAGTAEALRQRFGDRVSVEWHDPEGDIPF